MSKKDDVTEFVRKVFELYDANMYQFMYDFDPDTGKEREIPLFSGDDIDDETLSRISIQLGLTPAEILGMNFEAALKYWKKYEFFRLYRLYRDEWHLQSIYKGNPSIEDALLKAIFGNKAKIELNKRYNYKSVKQRMVQQLRNIDAVLPGTYHKYAKITKLKIDTEVFISFPQCGIMIRSFLEIVDTVKSLFFKGLKSDLSLDEINEYNFLVSWFYITDIVTPSVLITYNNLLLYRNVYLEENYSDFFSYAKIRNFIGTSPWRCKEFFDDLDLVQKFINIFPESRHLIREFSLAVSNFICTFIWSDAKPIMFSPEEEWEQENFMYGIGEENIPLEERAKELTCIYVAKTLDEMDDWAPYIKKLSRIAASTSKGGFAPIKREIASATQEDLIQRLFKRVEAKCGGN